MTGPDLGAVISAARAFLAAVDDDFEKDVSHLGPSLARLRDAVMAVGGPA